MATTRDLRELVIYSLHKKQFLITVITTLVLTVLDNLVDPSTFPFPTLVRGTQVLIINKVGEFQSKANNSATTKLVVSIDLMTQVRLQTLDKLQGAILPHIRIQLLDRYTLLPVYTQVSQATNSNNSSIVIHTLPTDQPQQLLQGLCLPITKLQDTHTNKGVTQQTPTKLITTSNISDKHHMVTITLQAVGTLVIGQITLTLHTQEVLVT